MDLYQIRARRLTRAQALKLMAHIDRPQQCFAEQRHTTGLMLQAGLLQGCNAEGIPKAWRPARWTKITDEGRAVLGHLLADYAEALIKIGFHEHLTEIERPSPVKKIETRFDYLRRSEGETRHDVPLAPTPPEPVET